MTWGEIEQLCASIESIMTAVGIIGAGLWGFVHFRRQREGQPHAAISHDTHVFRLPTGLAILKVAATIHNTGGVLLCLQHARTRVQQLAPVPEHIAAIAEKCGDSLPGNDCELPWPVLGKRQWNVEAGLGQIEPGESEVLQSDFVIEPGVEQVLLYTYVRNHTREDEIGWSDTRVICLKGEPRHHGKAGEPKS